jgi:hypothetical protein
MKNKLLLLALFASFGSVVNIWCSGSNKIGLPFKILTTKEAVEAADRAAAAREALKKCSICLGDFDTVANIVTLECNKHNTDAKDHSFHELCITKWFDTGNNNCPLCKTKGVNPNVKKQETMDEWRAGFEAAVREAGEARLAAARAAAVRAAAVREAAARETFRANFQEKFPDLYNQIINQGYRVISEDGGQCFFYKESGGGHGTCYKLDGIERTEHFGR